MARHALAKDPLLAAALLAGPVVALLLGLFPGVGLKPGLPAGGWQALLFFLLVYPVLEEWVFRGGLQPWLAQHITRACGPLSLANLLTTLVFTVLHFIYHPPLWALGVAIPSLVFGYFRERHDSVATPMLLHAVYNASYFLLLG